MKAVGWVVGGNGIVRNDNSLHHLSAYTLSYSYML